MNVSTGQTAYTLCSDRDMPSIDVSREIVERFEVETAQWISAGPSTVGHLTCVSNDIDRLLSAVSMSVPSLSEAEPELHRTMQADTEDPRAEHAAINAVMLGEVLQAIDALPVHHRTTMQLVCLAGYTYAETAQMLGISIGTVMSRIFVARHKLRTLLL